jgi:alkylation response protein AidB-like acyl-CoA dehydrogenase
MVYLENVVVPKANLIGEQGRGWTCAKYLLEFERGGNAYAPALKGALAHLRSVSASVATGQGTSLLDDAAFRARVDDVDVQLAALEFTELRILGALTAGQSVGPESSLLKTRGTELSQAITELFVEAAGYFGSPFDASTGEVDDPFEPVGPPAFNGVAQDYFNTRKVSIYAGSNEIQRNIMAKLVLGLG